MNGLSLGRDLNFVFAIPDLLQQAYEAGKAGQEFIVTEKTNE